MLEQINNMTTSEREALKTEVQEMNDAYKIDFDEGIKAYSNDNISLNIIIDIKSRKYNYCKQMGVKTLPFSTEEFVKIGKISNNDERDQKLRELLVEKIQNISSDMVLDNSKLSQFQVKKENNSLANNDLLSYIERIERLKETIAEINADIREIFVEAESEGYDAKAMKEVIRLRKMDPEKLADLDASVEAYRNALNV